MVIERLKKETNIDDTRKIGESYQTFEATNMSLSKQVQFLDEEVCLGFTW